jgi:hypothetical protein
MKMTGKSWRGGLLLAGLWFWLGTSPALQACSVCFGNSDAPMAQGMNAGIMTLLGVVLLLWAGVGSFFIHLARRSARITRESQGPAAHAAKL